MYIIMVNNDYVRDVIIPDAALRTVSPPSSLHNDNKQIKWQQSNQ